MTVNMPRLLRSVLVDDETGIVDAVAGTEVYAVTIPKDAEPPLILIPVDVAYPAAAPTVQWWEHITTFDIHGWSVDDANTLLDALIERIATIAGAYPDGVIADCQVESKQAVTDDGWKPLRHRHVVTVAVTAREP